MAKLCFGSLLTLSLIFGLVGNSQAGTNNFDNGKPGELPVGWSPELTGEGQPKWFLEHDESAPSKPLALKQAGWTGISSAEKAGTV